MAKLLNSAVMNGNIKKVVELADEYIINGQLYDKSTFVPKPMTFCPIGATANESMFYKTTYTDYTYGAFRTDNNVMTDSSDSDSVFFADCGPYQPTVLYKLTKTSNGISTRSVQIWPEAQTSCEIISQTSSKIYLILHRTYDSYSCYISRINKSNMAVDYNVNIGGAKSKVLYENDTFLYLATSTLSGYYIQKFNKTTGGNVNLLDDSKTGYILLSMPSSMSMKDNVGTVYAIRDGVYANPAVHSTVIRKYVIDFSTEKVTASDVKLDTSILGNKVFSSIADSTQGIMYELLNVTNGDKTYINMIIYNSGSTQYLALSREAIYTFEVVDADNFKLINADYLSPILYKSMIPLNNNKLLLLNNENGIAFYNWNSANKSYDKTSVYQVPTKVIGVDMNNNIWIQQNDNSMDLLANTLPTTIYALFDKDEYNFAGDDISSTLTVYAQNYAGQYLASTIQLTLIGQVKFTDTGLKTRTVTTSNLNKMQIPITITGAGMLNANFKLL